MELHPDAMRDEVATMEQGWPMQPPSPRVVRVRLEMADGKISRLMAGGAALIVSSLRVDV